MRNRIILGLLILIAIAGAYVYSRRTASPIPPATQLRPAPDFTLKQLSGEPLTLSTFRGKVVLLDFWATWCAPCREETPFFVDLQNKYGPQGLQIIGVSMDDTPDPVPAFVREFKMNYPVVMGDAKTGELYGGVLGLPIAFLIDREGHIRSRHMGATDASVFDREIVNLLKEEKNLSSKREGRTVKPDLKSHKGLVIPSGEAARNLMSRPSSVSSPGPNDRHHHERARI